MRSFQFPSHYTAGALALAIAPALTPTGVVENPSFFSGFAAQPQILARGLLVLADVTSTRYFKYIPVTLRDPVLSAQGDMLRSECFSACNGVYARLDLLQSGFDGHISHGTTNVDIGLELRRALTQVARDDRLHLDIGGDGLAATHHAAEEELSIHGDDEQGVRVVERPVQMPDRWVRAMGNAAEIHHGMKPVFVLTGPQAQTFVASLPHATAKGQSGWLVPTRMGAKLQLRQAKESAYVSGLHRLSALKRIMTNIKAVTFFMPHDMQPGASMIVAEMPGARLTLSLTAQAYQGYSGEGALLESLASGGLLADTEQIAAGLGFNSAIDTARIMKQMNMDSARVQNALALLAVSGRVGYDSFDGAYFHRELPHDPNRVLKDNPRLLSAKKLIGDVKHLEEFKWSVTSGGTDYRVTYDPALGANAGKCTCKWYLDHMNRRGPCKHILAVQLWEEE